MKMRLLISEMEPEEVALLKEAARIREITELKIKQNDNDPTLFDAEATVTEKYQGADEDILQRLSDTKRAFHGF
jgi:hypothetical protein